MLKSYLASRNLRSRTYPPTVANRLIWCSRTRPKDSRTTLRFSKGLLWTRRPSQTRNIVDSLTMSYWPMMMGSEPLGSDIMQEVRDLFMPLIFFDTDGFILSCGRPWVSFGNGSLTPWEWHSIAFPCMILYSFTTNYDTNIFLISTSIHPGLILFLQRRAYVPLCDP